MGEGRWAGTGPQQAGRLTGGGRPKPDGERQDSRGQLGWRDHRGDWRGVGAEAIPGHLLVAKGESHTTTPDRARASTRLLTSSPSAPMAQPL